MVHVTTNKCSFLQKVVLFFLLSGCYLSNNNLILFHRVLQFYLKMWTKTHADHYWELLEEDFKEWIQSWCKKMDRLSWTSIELAPITPGNLDWYHFPPKSRKKACEGANESQDSTPNILSYTANELLFSLSSDTLVCVTNLQSYVFVSQIQTAKECKGLG